MPTSAEDIMETVAGGIERRGDRARGGFTLVELLAVIAVIGVLVAMLLPAVQSARESGRRAQCSNNMRQVSLGMLGANDANGTLPGWRNRNPNPQSANMPSWPVVLMPFIERMDIHRKWAADGVTSGANSPAIPVLACPSTVLSGNETSNDPRLSYAGNCGSCTNRADGVMVDTSGNVRVPLNDVSRKDGTTFTILAAEKSGRAVTQGWWDMLPAGCGFGNGVAMNNATNYVSSIGITGSPGSPIVNATTGGPPGLWSQPSSNHPLGAVVGYCDGHVGYLTTNLRGNVYAQLLSWDHVTASAGPSTYTTWVSGYPVVSERDLR